MSDSCSVTGIFKVFQVRATIDPVGGSRPGASRSKIHAITAYRDRTTATRTNAACREYALMISTVLKAATAVPAVPIPQTPSAMPRLCGSYQHVTIGTPAVYA